VKILDLTEFYSERGGVRNHLDQKGRILRQLAHRHVIVAPGAEDGESELRPMNGASPEPGPAGSARVVRIAGPALPYDANYHLLWRLGRVRDVVTREKPDVLQINSPYLAALSLRRMPPDAMGIKTFWWHADFIDTYAVERLSRYLGAGTSDRMVRPLWAWVRSIGAACDATLAASRHQVDKLAEHGVPRVYHVPFGIDKDVFAPEQRSENWRSNFLDPAASGARDRTADVPILVAMGRLSVEKQWPVVLEGFAQLSVRRAARLVIYGDGPERQRLEQRWGGRPDVTFMGFEPDARKLSLALASADAFVHGCPFETFGLSVAQAIACGSPVVVPDRGGAAELAHSDFAELYRAGDPEAFAGAVERLLARDAAALRAAAIRGRAGIFGAVEQVKRTVDVYRELLARRAREGYNAYPSVPHA
jgi:alpha-1,6-mannosyltransferase